jgi:Fungal cellulose binding domain
VSFQLSPCPSILTAVLTFHQLGNRHKCDSNCTGTIAAQTYKNTVITLAAADTTFGSTLSLSGGTTYTGFASSEGGKVWTIATISVPAMLPDGISSVSSSSSSTTSVKTSTTTSSAISTGAAVAKYGQCGGIGYTGSTVCATGSTCTYSSAYYSQCL